MSVFEIGYLFGSQENHSHYRHIPFDVHLVTLLEVDRCTNRTLTTIKDTHHVPAELLNIM